MDSVNHLEWSESKSLAGVFSNLLIPTEHVASFNTIHTNWFRADRENHLMWGSCVLWFDTQFWWVFLFCLTHTGMAQRGKDPILDQVITQNNSVIHLHFYLKVKQNSNIKMTHTKNKDGTTAAYVKKKEPNKLISQVMNTTSPRNQLSLAQDVWKSMLHSETSAFNWDQHIKSTTPETWGSKRTKNQMAHHISRVLSTVAEHS